LASQRPFIDNLRVQLASSDLKNLRKSCGALKDASQFMIGATALALHNIKAQRKLTKIPLTHLNDLILCCMKPVEKEFS
jgi:hypothetical protein